MHRWSQLFIPTLREAPADAEVASHKLLLRAGYIRQLGAGIYSYLFLGNRSINKIVAIVREEMDTIGQEFFLPALNPAEIWQESGRWSGMGQNMFRLKDRKGADLCLAMTHEEVMTSIARNELRSYKQLPQIWYQIQTKFRDEPRPKSGLLRVRQFLMKDAYSFDIDEAGLDASYAKHDAAYRRIFACCGLEFVAVEADSGSMGGSQSQEFMVYTEAGEDLIASARDAAGSVVYAANIEKATSTLPPVTDLAPTGDTPEPVHTPNQRTIEEVSAYLNANHSFSLSTTTTPPLSSRSAAEGSAVLQPHHQIKTMAYMASFRTIQNVVPKSGGSMIEPVVVFLRGDHQLNEAKLTSILNNPSSPLMVGELRPMETGELQMFFNAPAGFLGPVGLSQPDNMTVILDSALENRSNLIAGANREDYHFRNVTPGRDFKPTVIADIRTVNEGEPDPIAGLPLRIGKAVEIGHIFKLGYKYSKSMGATVLNKDGKETTPIMGSYGIGIERILTAAIESSAAKFAAQNAADPKSSESYALPAAIAPFQIIVTITNVREPELLAAGEQIALTLEAAGFDVLLDDRDERAGVKFKDADLIGVPFRIAVGKKLAEGKVELLNRLTNQTHDIPLTDITQSLSSLLP
jgi:prolyl-tRNA synthetase